MDNITLPSVWCFKYNVKITLDIKIVVHKFRNNKKKMGHQNLILQYSTLFNFKHFFFPTDIQYFQDYTK